MDDAILWDGFEGAVIGTVQGWSDGSLYERICYDGYKMIEILVEDGMSQEEADEHIQFNVIGGYVGELTPVILWSATLGELVGGQ